MSCNDKIPAYAYCKQGQLEQFQAVLVPSAGQGYQSPPLETVSQYVALLNRNANNDCGEGRACSWWWVTVHPKAVIRREDGVSQQWAPLSQNEINRNGVSCSSLRVRITLSDNTNNQRVFFADVGQGISFPWYGPAVKIEVPTWNTRDSAEREVTKVGPNFDGFTGEAVEDVILEANAIPSDCCPTYPPLPMTLTEVERVGGTARDVFFNRPPAARRVAYYTTSRTPDEVQFVAVPGTPYDASTSIAQVIPSPQQANTRVGSSFVVPGPACALVLVNAAGGQYSAIWEIQP